MKVKPIRRQQKEIDPLLIPPPGISEERHKEFLEILDRITPMISREIRDEVFQNGFKE